MWNKLYDNNPNNIFFKYMANKRFRSAIYLLLWFIALGIVYITYIQPMEDYLEEDSNLTNETEVVDDMVVVSFEEKKEALLKKNYSYIYKYNDDEVYKGDLLENKSTGYLENSEGIKRYYIEDHKTYFVSFGVLSEANYDEKFSTFFDISYVFDLISDHYPIVFDGVYNYKIEDNYITISTDDFNIYEIEITWESNKYDLYFSNIGKIIDISY